MIWKGKAMKSNRFLFQLQVSTHRTKDIESGLLPTPTAMVGDTYADRSKNAHLRHSPNIATLAYLGLLPTPTCQDAKMKENSPSQQHKIHELSILVAGGSNFHLNPLFVEEMMGFPPNWTASPFLSGKINQSKPTETQ
jgi:hypothetical protein